jgi:hypothetical protein
VIRFSGVGMPKPIKSSNMSGLETLLMSLLMDRINKELGEIRSIYDIAWRTFALEYIGRRHERLYREACQIVSSLEQLSSEKLEGLLFHYRRAVGIALFIYLFRPESLDLSEERLDEICRILTANSESSEAGELIGATFLLLNHLKYKVLIDKIRVIMYKIREMALKEPEYYFIELMYISFFSAIANDDFYIETLEKIKRNEFLYEHILDDPEKLTLFLYIVSKVIDYKNKSLIEIEWCKTKRDEAANSLIAFLEENYSIIRSLINALRNLEFSKGRDYAYEDVEYDLMLARVDLIAKMVLALYEAGYLKPFMLSKKEVDAFRQIRAELKNYRRVRKYELMFILGVFILFMFLIPIILNSLFTNTTYFIQFILAYKYLYLIVLVIVVLIIRSIWSSGQINLEVIRNIVKEVLSLIKKLILGGA